MSYPNIVRKCSVCEGCGSCDYEYEVEYLGEISGDYSPLPHEFLASAHRGESEGVEDKHGQG